MLGTLSDTYGRKRVLLLSLSVVSLELVMLAIWPSITAVFLARVMSGTCDAVTQMVYAMVTDIAQHNEESVTKAFGLVGAAFGVGFILGPSIGSYLTTISISLCFATAAATAGLALLLALLFVKETNLQLQPFNRAKAWPLTSLRLFFANSDLASLSVPFMFSNLSTGLYFVWVLYMTRNFQASTMEIGLFLSCLGLFTVGVQGVLVPVLIPSYMSDEQATLRGLALSGLQLLVYGTSSKLEHFYLAMVCFAPASMYGPALKSLLVKKAGAEQQGALQGALGSIRTLSAGLGALFFSGVFSFTVTVQPSVQGLPFFFAATFYALAWTHTNRFLSMHGGATSGGVMGGTSVNVMRTSSDDAEENKHLLTPLGLLEGGKKTLRYSSGVLYVPSRAVYTSSSSLASSQVLSRTSSNSSSISLVPEGSPGGAPLST